MKRLLIAISLACLTLQAFGNDLPSILKKYLEESAGKADWNIAHASRTTKDGTLVFGAATEILPKDMRPDERTSVVFVLKIKPHGDVLEIARSKFFKGISDANVESLDVQSDARFSIQINGHSNFGGSVSVYRFATVRGTWKLAGLDNTTCNFNKNDESVCDSRTTRSANFLTGNFVRSEYINNKKTNTQRKLLQFSAIPISDFDGDCDDKFWAQ